MIYVLAVAVKNLKSAAANSMYQRPYNIEEIKLNYPDRATKLLIDPVHLWRAKTGIELIHKEPTKDEQIRIWHNWNEMSDELKEISDKKSIEFFGKDNVAHNNEVMCFWNEAKKYRKK